MSEVLVSIRHVSKVYSAGRGGFLGLGALRLVHALDDINLDIHAGEIVGLVGESGSGKSTLGKLIVGLEPPSAGEILLSGKPPQQSAAEGADLAVQMVFQNPSGSLNPRQRVRDIIAEPLQVYRRDTDIEARVSDLMEKVGLPASFADRRPHEMSGGQAQRVCIARALALDPRLIVCDEPISALDASIQAQVLNLFCELQEQTGCSYLFISHDLPVVERLSHRVAIMYLGRIVETAPTRALFSAPSHPYTRVLIESAPRLEARKRQFRPVEGEIPSPLDPPSGCHFHPRCPMAQDICRKEAPAVREVAPGHFSRCHFAAVPTQEATGAHAPVSV